MSAAWSYLSTRVGCKTDRLGGDYSGITGSVTRDG
jgi:hypothetical protein